jgi:hypothetical protein
VALQLVGLLRRKFAIALLTDQVHRWTHAHGRETVRVHEVGELS